MPVRFKSRSEYQKSFSVSPQRWAPLAGLRSDHMGISREPCLQRRKRLGQCCSSLIFPQDHQSHSTAPPDAQRKEAKPRPPPGPRADPGPATEAQTAKSKPTADPGTADLLSATGKPVKPRPSKPDSQPQPSKPMTSPPDGQQPPANETDRVLRWKAGLRSAAERTESQTSEYHRKFNWKKPLTSASPILTAQQMFHSGSRCVSPFKKNVVPMETEYGRSFQGLAPPTGQRLRKQLEHQRVPLFHTHMTNKKRREESQRREQPKHDASPPPPPQGHRGHRIPEEGLVAADDRSPQVQELRQKALMYRQRAWGANFSRDHLNQLRSEHNVLWEETDTGTDRGTDRGTDTGTDTHTPHTPSGPMNHETHSPVEPLELHSLSSKRSSVIGSGENPQRRRVSPPSPPADRRTAWAGAEEETTEEDEGRLPTPRLKLLPVQRTHHDLTTPATGGAILVGKLKGSEDSPFKQQRSGSAVDPPVKLKEAWSENNSSSSGSSHELRPAHSPPSKPIRAKQRPSHSVARPPLVHPTQHGIHGTLRNADFQHNGELGLRFRERQCPGGGCGSDEDDRLSVMSWRSAASCSVASAILDRAQKRRENFWGKR